MTNKRTFREVAIAHQRRAYLHSQEAMRRMRLMANAPNQRLFNHHKFKAITAQRFARQCHQFAVMAIEQMERAR